MNSFKEAFAHGIEQAEVAAANIAEIEGVLEEFTNAISESSDGKIEVYLKNSSEILEEEIDDAYRLAINTALLKPNLKTKKRHYKALQAKRAEGDTSKGIEICEWGLSDNGYPVDIEYSGHSSSFYDKESLERGLAKLISSPATGKVFKQLMDS